MKHHGRVIYVGPVIEKMPCPTIPFFGWLRFRPQEIKSKIKLNFIFIYLILYQISVSSYGFVVFFEYVF